MARVNGSSVWKNSLVFRLEMKEETLGSSKPGASKAFADWLAQVKLVLNSRARAMKRESEKRLSERSAIS